MKHFKLLLLSIILLNSCKDDDTLTPFVEPAVIAEFKMNLSELNIFTGNLSDLTITTHAFEYSITNPSFADYSKKQRLIALPTGTKLTQNGDGLPVFPDGSLIAKTFYYNNDERDVSLGRRIIETRVLIKVDGDWQTGDYIWNDEQTEATLDNNGSTLPINWIDTNGDANSITYEIPDTNDCFTCHSSFDDVTPIGPKLRNLNFVKDGNNQLQDIINNGNIDGITDSNTISTVTNWEDTSESLEDRARAYMDINCAYCHQDGGYCDDQSTLRLTYEKAFGNTRILERKNSISNRISTYSSGFSMPYIGTTILHNEGVALMQAYLDTL